MINTLSVLRGHLNLTTLLANADMTLLDGVSPATVRDLWMARFGNEWVSPDDIAAAGEFYKAATYFLEHRAELELMYVASEYRTAVRLNPTEDKDGTRRQDHTGDTGEDRPVDPALR